MGFKRRFLTVVLVLALSVLCFGCSGMDWMCDRVDDLSVGITNTTDKVGDFLTLALTVVCGGLKSLKGDWGEAWEDIQKDWGELIGSKAEPVEAPAETPTG